MSLNAVPAPPQGAASDNKGDVLASIRRLIAQDDARQPDPAEQLRLAAQYRHAQLLDARMAEEQAAPRPQPPLVLESDARLPPRAEDQGGPEPAASSPSAAAAQPAIAARVDTTQLATEAEHETVPDLHLFAPVEDELISSSVMRRMIREAIRDELQGDMGARLSRNLRQVIRGEVEVALRQMLRRPGD